MFYIKQMGEIRKDFPHLLLIDSLVGFLAVISPNLFYLAMNSKNAVLSVNGSGMEKTFDLLIDTFLLNKVGIAENFLSDALVSNLSKNLDKLLVENKLLEAKIGNGDKTLLNTQVRNDKIYWLDRKHNDATENTFFDLMDAFVLYLNRTCFTGITGYEFHYALYEKGSFYKKHFDQFRTNSSRQFTMIFYLNTEWKLIDGGELRIYQQEGVQNISPTAGKSVFFKSNELAHEVVLTNKARRSITGWFKVN